MDKKRTRYLDYKIPVIKVSKSGMMHIEYYYRIPAELFKLYKKEWKRFKIYEDINRNKSLEYAKSLRDSVEIALEKGYNPFAEKDRKFAEMVQPVQKDKVWSTLQALQYFLQKWRERGLLYETMAKYERVVKFFIEWLTLRDLQHDNIITITQNHVELFLSDTKKSRKWSNREYNNSKNFLRTAFIYLTKKGIVKVNPTLDIDKLQTKSTKHKYYDEQTFQRVKIVMNEYEPYLLFACQVVYYLCIRSVKELQHFKVGNILPERMQVLVEQGKGSKDRYIPLPEEMLSIFKERKIFDYPPNFYVFGNKGKPAASPVGKNFFIKRFQNVRKLAKIDSGYTVYSFKHTRVVHLKLDGAKDEEIMSLTGHTNYGAFVTYLRDLGTTVDPDAINKKTRKF